jgi:hypothetical protein
MTRFMLLIGAAIACACSSDPAKQQASAKDEAARMRAPEVPLAKFGSVELLPTAISPDVASKPERVPVAEQLGQKLEARLRPLIQEWGSSAPAELRGRVLVIKPTVVALKVVSAGIFRSAWAGDSYITLQMVLTDKESGRVIADPIIKKSADAWEGAMSASSSDKSLADYVVSIAYQYLLDNHKP